MFEYDDEKIRKPKLLFFLRTNGTNSHTSSYVTTHHILSPRNNGWCCIRVLHITLQHRITWLTSQTIMYSCLKYSLAAFKHELIIGAHSTDKRQTERRPTTKCVLPKWNYVNISDGTPESENIHIDIDSTLVSLSQTTPAGIQHNNVLSIF